MATQGAACRATSAPFAACPKKTRPRVISDTGARPRRYLVRRPSTRATGSGPTRTTLLHRHDHDRRDRLLRPGLTRLLPADDDVTLSTAPLSDGRWQLSPPGTSHREGRLREPVRQDLQPDLVQGPGYTCVGAGVKAAVWTGTMSRAASSGPSPGTARGRPRGRPPPGYLRRQRSAHASDYKVVLFTKAAVQREARATNCWVSTSAGEPTRTPVVGGHHDHPEQRNPARPRLRRLPDGTTDERGPAVGRRALSCDSRGSDAMDGILRSTPSIASFYPFYMNSRRTASTWSPATFVDPICRCTRAAVRPAR